MISFSTLFYRTLSFKGRLSIGALPLMFAWALLVSAASSVGQEAEGEATRLTATEAQAFLGYWMLEAKLGEQPLEMGLEIDEDFESPGAVATTLVSSLFGELEASNLRRVEEKFSFDVTTAFGDFVMDLWFEDQQLRGKLADASGAFSADVVAEPSDRISYERFRVPEDESRIEIGETMIRLRFVSPAAGETDFEQIATIEPGKVVRFLDEQAIKLATDLTLRFGELEVNPGNVADNYPGVYSLWLKRTEGGWNLVFNHKPDVWGTQHDPAADLGEVPLTHGKAEEASDVLVGSLDELPEGGRNSALRLTWGSHTWSAPFEVLLPRETGEDAG